MTTTAVDLLDSIRAHLVAFELSDLWSVHVVASFSGPNVTVQLARRELPKIVGALLAWADTLTEVTAEAWRVPGGDCVHLSVIGRLPRGVSVRVHGGVPFTGRGSAATSPRTAAQPCRWRCCGSGPPWGR